MTATATAAAVAWLLAVATTLGLMGAPRGVHELQITIGDVTVRALCTDRPRDALLLHDVGSTSDSWPPVLERLDEYVGACAYDRRGSGMSVPPPSERGRYEFLDELRHVHRTLGFDRDYLLVGHGLGGLYARMYVIDRPRELGALLLVDPSHEDMPDRFAAGMPERERLEWIEQRSVPNLDGIRKVSLDTRLRRLRTPRVPVTVLTAAQRSGSEGWNSQFIS